MTLYPANERRSLLIPILVAIAVLAIATALAVHYFPSTSMSISHVHTDAIEEHTTFKSQSIVVGDSIETDLYILTTVRVVNGKRMPLFVNDITCTVTDQDGGQMKVSALTQPDIDATEQSFPKLRPLLTTPLLRESTIARDQAVTGTVLFHLPFAKAVWDARKEAVVQIDFHQQDESLSVTIPK